jgi:hypothetical protein
MLGRMPVQAEIGGRELACHLPLVGVCEHADASILAGLAAKGGEFGLRAAADDGEHEVVGAVPEQALQETGKHVLALRWGGAAHVDEASDAPGAAGPRRLRCRDHWRRCRRVEHMDRPEIRVECRFVLRRSGRVRYDEGLHVHPVDAHDPRSSLRERSTARSERAAVEQSGRHPPVGARPENRVVDIGEADGAGPVKGRPPAELAAGREQKMVAPAVGRESEQQQSVGESVALQGSGRCTFSAARSWRRRDEPWPGSWPRSSRSGWRCGGTV